jgi:hypothetical protein
MFDARILGGREPKRGVVELDAVIAYLDPGTGSVILQAILGGVAAAVVTAKLWWGRFTSIFRRAPQGEAQAEEAEARESEPAQG